MASAVTVTRASVRDYSIQWGSHTCKDIDECAEQISLCQGICVNGTSPKVPNDPSIMP